MATKKKVTKKKTGRPTKFNEEIQKQMELLYKEGFTDKKVAKVLLIDEATINNWKIAHPRFFESLKDWKLEADRDVVKSLYKRACGFKIKEAKVGFFNGMATVEEIEKEILPDPTSMIFWLKNRQPDQWREKSQVEFDHTNAKDETLVSLAKKALKELDGNKNKKLD